MRRQTLFLVMKQTIQNGAIADILNTKLNCETPFISNELSLTILDGEKSPLLLVDVTNLPNIDQHHWNSLFNTHLSQAHTILLNTSQNVDKKDLLHWPNCCGVFQKSYSLDSFQQGMQKILAGEYWLPRAMMSELLQHYRKDDLHSDQQLVSLTRRECDVLRLLTTCNSNLDIANELFISEHTVKSHLYKIFKKTDVQNRNQATNWAKDNPFVIKQFQRKNTN
tara:strand:+ start:1604 stop:2272 length:669 start_codon:yes stop_codon:yes gene_type:complete